MKYLITCILIFSFKLNSYSQCEYIEYHKDKEGTKIYSTPFKHPIYQNVSFIVVSKLFYTHTDTREYSISTFSDVDMPSSSKLRNLIFILGDRSSIRIDDVYYKVTPSDHALLEQRTGQISTEDIRRIIKHGIFEYKYDLKSDEDKDYSHVTLGGRYGDDFGFDVMLKCLLNMDWE